MLSTLTTLGLLNPTKLIDDGGLALVAAIIFAESGLLIGFFLPGDSLLFITGFLTIRHDHLPHISTPLPLVLAVLFVAAAAGDQVGYGFGRKVGPALFQRPESRLFRPAHVVKAQTFFDRYGAKTILMARFVPVVRTFAPILAGVGSMRYRTFLIYNLIGALVWAAGVTTLGRLLGNVSWVKDNIELASIAIVAASLLPVAIEVVRHRRAHRAA